MVPINTTFFIDKNYTEIPFEDIPGKISTLDAIYNQVVLDMDRVNEEEKTCLDESGELVSERDSKAKVVAENLLELLRKNNLLTTKLSSELIVACKGKASERIVSMFCRSEYQAIRERLSRQKEIGDKIFPDIDIANGFVDKKLGDMGPNVAKGAIEVLDGLKMNFVADPENIKDKNAIKELVGCLDEYGLVTAGMAAAYSQGSVDKIIRSIDSLSANLEKIALKGPVEKPASIGARIAGAMIADNNPVIVILGGTLALAVKSVELIMRPFRKDVSFLGAKATPQEAFRVFTEKRLSEGRNNPYSISPRRSFERFERRSEMAAEDLSTRKDIKLGQDNTQNIAKGLTR